MDMNRKQFLRAGGAALVGSSLAALGFFPTQALAESRTFKLSKTKMATFNNFLPNIAYLIFGV